MILLYTEIIGYIIFVIRLVWQKFIYFSFKI